ncbi:MAG: glycosyltransferase family 2 protein [Candidatus Microgenomates bacterium]
MKKTNKIKHAVILINYQDANITANCIKSIQKSKDAPHIIVVDNGSSKECLAKLKSLCPALDLIETGFNIGFSAGNNIGIKKALRLGAQVVYLINNDTLVDENLFFRSYRFVAKKNRIAGAKIYYAKGYEYHESQRGLGNVLWYAGGYFDYSDAVSRHYGIDEIDQSQYDKVKKVDFVTGCFMAIPRLVLKKIGILSEEYFLYLEDADYCLRALKNNIEVIYNPNLILYHLNGGSVVAGSKLVDYYMTRNRFYITRRYGSWRLRFALHREAVLRNWSNPLRRLAYLDYLFGRMGNRNAVINQLIGKT